MPTLCSTCGGRCGQDSAECIYAGTGAAVTGQIPIKPTCCMTPANECTSDQVQDSPASAAGTEQA